MERYYTFLRRLAAGIFDSFILAVISLVATKLINFESENSIYVWGALLTVFSILYNIILTGLFGQTLGKLVMEIKVLDLNEKSVIGIKRAIFRDSVVVFLQLFSLILLGLNNYAVLSISDGVYSFLDAILNWISFGWFVLELATMFLNEKRRAIHDLLASSVVISLKGLKMDQFDQEAAVKRLDVER